MILKDFSYKNNEELKDIPNLLDIFPSFSFRCISCRSLSSDALCLRTLMYCFTYCIIPHLFCVKAQGVKKKSHKNDLVVKKP